MGNSFEYVEKIGKELLKSQAKLTLSEAREKVLLEACNSILNAHLRHDEGYILINISSLQKVKDAVASTGKEQLEKDLEEAERALRVIYAVEWPSRYCWFCDLHKDKGHNNTCRLAALKKEWEAKRDNLMKLIGEI